VKLVNGAFWEGSIAMSQTQSDIPHDIAHVIAPPPLIYLGTLLIGLVLGGLFPVTLLTSPLQWIIGLPLIIIGVVLVGSAFTAMQQAGTSPIPLEPTKAIVTNSVYVFTRNPIYLGFTLVYAGIAIAFNSLWALILLILVLIVMDRGVIAREEAYLERKFGDVYLQYKTKVRRWL
jgi:protein-S-isoprenylcysteine O-methyltransferase Ste14